MGYGFNGVVKTPGCSVVIRCFNEEKHIARLLDGIMHQTLRDVEIIVVDSGSTDETLAIASGYPVKILNVAPEKFSFGHALNIGCEAAGNELIVIASAHVYPVYKDWLERLVAPMDDSRVALVYGRQQGNARTKYSEHQIFAKWFSNESNPDQDHPFCNNANAAIRRSLWRRLPYDETLTGLEDIDWAKRALQDGHKVVYAADAQVIHVHDETPMRIYNRHRREAIALKKISPQEHFSLWDFVRLFPANVLSDWYHAKRDKALWPNLISIFIFRLMHFWGTYRGFARRGPVPSQLKQTFYYPHGLARPKPMAAKPEAGPKIEYDIHHREGQIGGRD